MSGLKPLRVNVGERDHARSHSPAHHGNGRVHHGILQGIPHQLPGRCHRCQCKKHGAEGHGQKLQRASDQKLSVHTEDGPRDQHRDKKVKESGRIQEIRYGDRTALRYQMQPVQGRRPENAHDGPAAKPAADNRERLSQGVKQAAQEDQHDQRADHIRRQEVQMHGRKRQRAHPQIQRQRNPVNAFSFPRCPNIHPT